MSYKVVEHLNIRDGIAYEVNSDIPYTGKYRYIVGDPINKPIKVESSWKDGKQHGITVQWDEIGRKSEESNWKNGELDGISALYYTSGQKRVESSWKNGKQHGITVQWYEDGHKSEESNWKDDKRHGVTVQWDENGKKFVESNWKDDKRHGLTVKWYENGQKSEESDWENGLGMYEVKYNRDGNKKGCYVVTSCMGDINHPYVCDMRLLRDGVLVKSKMGKVFIAYYYGGFGKKASKAIDNSFSLKFLSKYFVVFPVVILFRIYRHIFK